ncbi:MAG: stage II sporulation protein P [Clostridia bacterium]
MRTYRRSINNTAPFAAEVAQQNRHIQIICFLVWLVLLGGSCVLCSMFGLHTMMLSFGYPAYAMLKQAAPAPEIVELSSAVPMQITVKKKGTAVEPVMLIQNGGIPRILIYHTHATEAYLMTEDSPYEPSGKWRTADFSKSVVVVGEKLKQILETEYGLSVLHDVQNHEPPKLSTAYSRSLLAMQGYQERYPSITVFIDVHRDAYGTTETTPKDYFEMDGKQLARLMFVVGTGKGATGSGFADMPDFDSNLAFAKTIQERLKEMNGQFVRDIRIKTGRYNQHMSNHCLLVEVGHNANTLEQALNSVPYLAKAIYESLAPAEQLQQMETMVVWTP